MLFGVDLLMGATNGRSAALDLLPHAGVYRPFAIIPEVLHLGPYMNAGIGFIDADHPDFDRRLRSTWNRASRPACAWAHRTQCGRSGSAPLSGMPMLSGSELFIGAQLDLYRLAGRTETRHHGPACCPVYPQCATASAR